MAKHESGRGGKDHGGHNTRTKLHALQSVEELLEGMKNAQMCRFSLCTHQCHLPLASNDPMSSLTPIFFGVL